MSGEHTFTEGDWEDLALEALGELGWKPTAGSDIAPGKGERESWDELLIVPRLRAAITRFNPAVPAEYVEQALQQIVSPASRDAIAENHRIHDFIVNGFRELSYIDLRGEEQTPTIRLVSQNPDENDYLAVNQVTIEQGDRKRRFDVVLYLNGMPVSIIELKNASDEHTGIRQGYAQLQTYLREFPLAFRFTVDTLISDGVTAAYGTPFTPLNHYSPWSLDDDGQPVKTDSLETALDLALNGLYRQDRFIDLMFRFIAFDEGDFGLAKRIAKPHQYFAVNKAVATTIQAVESNGKAGVVWHTQGSGKSMEMELYANLVTREPKLVNPTLVVITDRNELDGQLYETFKQSLLLPERPRQVRRRDELRAELSGRNSGGIYFTTLQKFSKTKDEKDAGNLHPELSSRRNIVVIVDEAHRSHYDQLDGYAKHLRDALPHATLIAFTGTPISFDDRNTRDVFGDYIDIYDLSRAIDDGATVPVYYESRLVKVGLAESVSEEDVDAAADEAAVGLDDTERDRLERGIAVINAVYGAPARLKQLADDLVAHWETRRATMRKFIDAPGKAMIVCSTRQICANLYTEITALRPDWHSNDLSRGKIKVVYSGDRTDEPPISAHVRRDSDNAVVKKRLKDVDDELEIVIVKDMMLTGYDSPPLHTLYLDRPIKGALLMQTLARVNRTFRGKQDGLLVGYAPLADNLAAALSEYSSNDIENKPVGRDIDAAIEVTKELLGSLDALLAGHPWRRLLSQGTKHAFVDAGMSTVNFLRSPETPGNQVAGAEKSLVTKYRELSGQLSRAWALCSQTDELKSLSADAVFFEAVRVWMAKQDAEERKASGVAVPDDVQRLLQDLVALAVDSDEVLDIYGAAGVAKPSLTEINDEFAAQAKESKYPHLAIESLRNLIAGETAKVTTNNAVRQRAFSARLTELMAKYTNQQLSTAEVIAAMIDFAREVADEGNRGAEFDPPLTDDELAFYDAVAQNDSAVQIQGEDELAAIARDLVKVMRRDVRTDWSVREDVKAKLRSSIKRLLITHGYPPDKQPAAIKLVLEQMESLAPKMLRERGSEA